MPDAELTKEELERVFGLYTAQLRSFRRTLYLVIVAGLALFALLVVPFLTYRDQIGELQKSETALTEQKLTLEGELEIARSHRAEIAKLSSGLYRFAERLRAYETLEELIGKARAHDAEMAQTRRGYASYSDESVQAWAEGEADKPSDAAIASHRGLYSLAQQSCVWTSGVDHIACQICESLTRRARVLEGSRAVADLMLYAGVRDPQQDPQGFSALAERSCAWLSREAPHWFYPNYRIRDPNDLRAGVSKDLQVFEAELNTFLVQARTQIAGLELAMAENARELQVTADRIATNQAQLDRIEGFDHLGTPVGNIPIGLGQLVLLFPAAMALAYLVVANSHAHMAALRRAFVRLSRRHDTDGAVMDPGYLSVIAPLWLDPRDPLPFRLVKWATAAVPAALILLNLWLIYRTQALTEKLSDDAALSPAVYIALYGLSLVMAAGALASFRAGHDAER